MAYRQSHCDYSCNECGRVCPTLAIVPLTLEVKRRTVIGRAYVDRSRCIPWADGKTCLVCEELCPVPNKAIALLEEEIPETTDAAGTATVKIKLPVVLPERCIGCGICEHHCPVPHEAAIRVWAVAGAGASQQA